MMNRSVLSLTLARDRRQQIDLQLLGLQRIAVKWMLEREEVNGTIPDPCWRRFTTERGSIFWGCTVTGKFRVEAPVPILDSKGGFFCDEPVRVITSLPTHAYKRFGLTCKPEV